MLDVADDGAGKLDGTRDIQGIAFHEHDVGSLLGDIGARTDRQADVSAGEGGGVVDAVAHHGDPMAGILQLTNHALLVGGEHVGDDLPHAHTSGDGMRRKLVVAREHDGAHAERVECGDGLPAGGLELIGNGDRAHERAVLGKEERRLAVAGKGLELRAVDLDGQVGHEGGVARGDAVGALARRHASPGNRLERLHGAGHDAALFGVRHDRLGERVLAVALERRGELEESLLADGGLAVGAACGQDVGDDGLALGDGAGFVEHHGVHVSQGLERLGALEQDAHLGTAPGAHHDGDGGGQAQRARAADDHDRDGRGEGLVHIAAGRDEPHRKRHGRDDEHRGHKDRGDLVRDARDGRLGGVGVLDQADDACQVGVSAHAGGAKGKRAGAVDGRGAHRVARGLLHGDGLAGEGALVDGRGSLEHHAVHGDGLARAHQNDLAGLDVVGVEGALGAVGVDDRRRLGGEVDEGLDCAAGLGLAARLEVFAHRHEGEDGARALQVEVVHAEGVRRVDVAHRERRADAVDAVDGPGDARGGADGDERIHGGGAVDERLEPVFEVRVVDVEDGCEQEQLGEREVHDVLGRAEKRRQRPAEHVPHP